MKTWNRGVSMAMALAGALTLALPSARAQAPRRQEGEGLYVPVELPAGVTREQARRPDPALRQRLGALLAERVRAARPPAGERVDAIALLVDAAGAAVTPDLDEARDRARLGLAATAIPTELTFTFDSPDPWTPEQLATLQGVIGAVYPLIREVVGPPFFSITVNVVKDPWLGWAGMYSPASNTLALSSLEPDVVCHEIIHAFRDDKVIGLGTIEEGMTRAAEVEVMSRLPALGYWNAFHSHPYDVRYEVLGRRSIAGANGYFATWFNPFLRYELAGMAWAKVIRENPAFLAAFNARVLAASYAWEQEYVDFAAAAQPLVEGRPFAIWYQQQPIFDRYPPTGYFLYQRASDLLGVFFHRDGPFANEAPVAGALVQWSIRDASDAVLYAGTETTGPSGLYFLGSDIPSYQGRMKVTSSAVGPAGPVEDVAYDRRSCQGLFGFVLGANDGTLTVTPLAGQAPPETVPVVDGGFCAGTLGGVAGPFRADFTGTAGQVGRHTFTKDASPYLAVVRTGDVTPPALQVPAHVVASADRPGGAYAPFVPTAVDDFDPRPAVDCSPRAGSLFPVGSTEVTCQAWDESENASRASFRVHVKGALEQVADLAVEVARLPAKRRLLLGLEGRLASAFWALWTSPGGTGACAPLAAFQGDVQAQSGSGLTADAASRLAGTARRIRDVLACP